MRSNPLRRGNYSIMMAMFAIALVGFGAIAVDLSLMRMAKAEAQDVADAASQAAVITLRRTGDLAAAEESANFLVQQNTVAFRPPSLETIEFGQWDEDGLAFSSAPGAENAVRVRVSGGNKMLLGTLFGRHDFDVSGNSVSATGSIDVILVMDITGSFTDEIHYARAAAQKFLEILGRSHGVSDQIGMVLFYTKYGVEYSPLQLIHNEFAGESAGSLNADWSHLDVAGKNDAMPKRICGHGDPHFGPGFDNEHGTAHQNGLEMALKMMQEERLRESSTSAESYKAIIMLTDGKPSFVRSYADDARDAIGYVEDRWRLHQGDKGLDKEQITNRTLAVSDRIGDEDINLWMISFDNTNDNSWMLDAAKGDGEYIFTTSAASLVPIFAGIAESLPMSITK